MSTSAATAKDVWMYWSYQGLDPNGHCAERFFFEIPESNVSFSSSLMMKEILVGNAVNQNFLGIKLEYINYRFVLMY